MKTKILADSQICISLPLKAFIKPFEVPENSVKITILINFYFSI